MIKYKEKVCDLCGKVVAIKYGLVYTTKEDFVTIREDCRVSYVNMEDNTTVDKRHYCCSCFDKICASLR